MRLYLGKKFAAKLATPTAIVGEAVALNEVGGGGGQGCAGLQGFGLSDFDFGNFLVGLLMLILAGSGVAAHSY